MLRAACRVSEKMQLEESYFNQYGCLHEQRPGSTDGFSRRLHKYRRPQDPMGLLHLFQTAAVGTRSFGGEAFPVLDRTLGVLSCPG